MYRNKELRVRRTGCGGGVSSARKIQSTWSVLSCNNAQYMEWMQNIMQLYFSCGWSWRSSLLSACVSGERDFARITFICWIKQTKFSDSQLHGIYVLTFMLLSSHDQRTNATWNCVHSARNSTKTSTSAWPWMVVAAFARGCHVAGMGHSGIAPSVFIFKGIAACDAN